MKTHTTNEAAAAHSDRQTAGAGHTAQLRTGPSTTMADTSAAAATLQRYQQLANNSPQAMQLKQRAEMMTASPAAAPLQRYQQLANNSPQGMQLKQRAEMMAASTSAASMRATQLQMKAPVQRAPDEELLQGKFAPVQRQEEDEPLQGKFATVQRVGDDELLQGKFDPVQRQADDELLQGKFATVQRAEDEELLQRQFAPVQRIDEEESLQGKFDALQRKDEGSPLQGQFEQTSASDAPSAAPVQREEKPNNTGLPNQLKAGIESLSGMSMDHVKVHYNSDKPAQLQAHAYAQGSEIHVAPGQEQHLPHEAWHVVQQAQGRVKPTMQMKGGVAVNDDVGLEGEADLMGGKATTTQLSVATQRRALNSKFTFPSPGRLLQRVPITATKDAALGWVQGKNAGSNFVHFNIQMSGDSRLAVASVGHAKKNETSASIQNGLIVSVPGGTEVGAATPYAYVDQRLYGSLSSSGVGEADTTIYATAAVDPHASRTESLGNWPRWRSRYDPPKGRRPARYVGWNVYQTGGVSEYVSKYENVDMGDQSFKSSLEIDYGVKNRAGLTLDETKPAAGVLGSKLASFNHPGKIVMWFKGDPTLSVSINSLQTAKTEHWLGADAGARMINQFGVGNVIIAGTLSPGYKVILDRIITNADQYITVDKLQAVGLNKIAEQYGFFYRYGGNMTHFGGRSGNLEPLAALGLTTIYFEEKGNGQADRDLHIGKDNHIDKVVIDGVTSSAGIISKGLAWIDSRTGTYRAGSTENADVNQQAYYDKVINRWMGVAEITAMPVTRRKDFYHYFLKGQEKNRSMLANSAEFKRNMDFPGQTHTPAQHEEQILSGTDLTKIVKGVRLKGPGGQFVCVRDNIAMISKATRFYSFSEDDKEEPARYVKLEDLLASWKTAFAGAIDISNATVKTALLTENKWIIDNAINQSARTFSLFDDEVFGAADVKLD